MAQTNFTPISLYYSTTAAATPSSANLVNGELAINIANTDMALFTKNASGTVKLLFNNPAALKYPTADGTANQVIKTDGAGNLSFTNAATGTVTSVSVVSANGLAGTVANASTTPAITLSTTVTGLIKGNGTSLSAATAGTDYVAPGTASTFTAQQTFNGSATVLATTITNTAEPTSISATAATGTINFDVTTQSVLYYTTNATGNFTINVRASATQSLNNALATGQSVTFVFMNTNGATAFYQTGFQVDGASVTPKWQGGTAPTQGNASSIDVYSYTVIKTGAATFTALAALNKFA